MMASCKQRLRWAQGQFDCAGRYIPKLFATGIKTGNIMILDGIFQVSQPYFLLFDYCILGVVLYQYVYSNFYTNILYQIMPMSVWTYYRCWSIFIPINRVIEKLRCHQRFGSTIYYIHYLFILGFQ